MKCRGMLGSFEPGPVNQEPDLDWEVVDEDTLDDYFDDYSTAQSSSEPYNRKIVSEYADSHEVTYADVTGKTLDPELVKKAQAEEIAEAKNYVVWRRVSRQEGLEYTGGKKAI